MAVERTFSIIKPDAVAKNAIGQILARFEAAGLKIIAARMMHLSRAQAEGFYAVHRERPFFKDLVDFMISGPVLVQVLQGENAIAEEPRADGRHRSEEGGQGHHPRRLRRLDRRQRGARLGCAGDRAHRDRLLLPGVRDLSALEPWRAEPSRPRLAGHGTALRRHRREAVPRAPGPEVDPSPRRRRFRRDDRHREGTARQARSASAAIEPPVVVGDGTARRRHAQVAAQGGRRQRGRGGVHSRGRPRHAVRLEPGRLHARLRVLLDRQAGLQPQPERRRDHRPALAREPARSACHAGGARSARSATWCSWAWASRC